MKEIVFFTRFFLHNLLVLTFQEQHHLCFWCISKLLSLSIFPYERIKLLKNCSILSCITVQTTISVDLVSLHSTSLTFLLLPIFFHISSTQQGEDDACLRVDTYSCHQHPARALHHMGTLTSKQITCLGSIKRLVWCLQSGTSKWSQMWNNNMKHHHAGWGKSPRPWLWITFKA